MALNINGTTGISGVEGSVSAPVLTGTDSNCGISFPSADTIKFSTGGVERMSITNSGVTGAGGKFASYALIADHKSSGTPGGTFVSGAWRTRDLNTEVADADGIVSISSNQFTLQAGTYFIRWKCPVYGRDYNQSRLYNITDSSVVANGMSMYSWYNGNVSNTSDGSTRVTISGAKVFELQHRTSQSSSGENTAFGVRVGNQFTVTTEVYSQCEIFKES